MWSLVPPGHLRLEAVLLMWLQLPREWLLVLGGDTRLLGHIPMWVGLLGGMRVRARNSPWSRLVPLRQTLGVLLRVLLLLRLGCSSWALNGHPWLGHKLRVGPHLWGHSVAC